MKSLIKKYQMQERRNYIEKQTANAIKTSEAIRAQVEYLDKFVDLDSATIVTPLISMTQTHNDLVNLMESKNNTNHKLDEMQQLGFMLEAQTSTLKQNVEDVLSQGIDFLKLPEFEQALNGDFNQEDETEDCEPEA